MHSLPFHSRENRRVFEKILRNRVWGVVKMEYTWGFKGPFLSHLSSLFDGSYTKKYLFAKQVDIFKTQKERRCRALISYRGTRLLLFKIAPTTKSHSPEIIPLLGDVDSVGNALALQGGASIFGHVSEF